MEATLVFRANKEQHKDPWKDLLETSIIRDLPEEKMEGLRIHMKKCHRCAKLFDLYDALEMMIEDSLSSVDQRKELEERVRAKAARKYQKLLAEVHEPEPPKQLLNEPLTEREEQVLGYIRQDKSNLQIAKILGVSSPGTIANVVKRIKLKTGLETREELKNLVCK